MEARVNIALSNIIAEIDRRCNKLTHPIPDDPEEVANELEYIYSIARQTFKALRATEDELDNVQAYIKELKRNEQDKETD